MRGRIGGSDSQSHADGTLSLVYLTIWTEYRRALPSIRRAVLLQVDKLDTRQIPGSCALCSTVEYQYDSRHLKRAILVCSLVLQSILRHDNHWLIAPSGYRRHEPPTSWYSGNPAIDSPELSQSSTVCCASCRPPTCGLHCCCGYSCAWFATWLNSRLSYPRPSSRCRRQMRMVLVSTSSVIDHKTTERCSTHG